MGLPYHPLKEGASHWWSAHSERSPLDMARPRVTPDRHVSHVESLGPDLLLLHASRDMWIRAVGYYYQESLTSGPRPCLKHLSHRASDPGAT
ncbi:uncharacterized protein BO88DRAFT_109749 [Aspergillus vadensis CBS 113365]|uniref:Uncharacterized protein n=1 Tax=Aspergillus vadensis (strain CBS 113365 / IMI 142717 / IBT 24658) TaxID=1448311 RepID=A0A319D1I0_ASPVC|nr:hypothetical protein BO88DRAFT_109749 [Aspergillus vadensis CBS 113365]PYH73962.1 hypothetical protein BO88DRAFT_109749 [Aspergillus vadensis CBS 113365]